MTFVTRIVGTAALGAVMVIGSSLSAPPAQAGYIVTLTQAGTSVVASGSGLIDLTGLTFESSASNITIAINPSVGTMVIGPTPMTGNAGDQYFGLSGPTTFGSGGFTVATRGSGDIVGEVFGTLYVPKGYVSDNPLSSSATWNNATLNSLGVTPGAYEWTWGTGSNQNLTLDIMAAPVPEPSALSALGVGLAALALAGLWRRRRQT